MRFSLHFRSSAALLAVALVAGCQRGTTTPPSGGPTPTAALEQSVNLVRAGRFADFWHQALPPADYATLRADWAKRRTEPSTLPPADQLRVDAVLAALTAPDAAKTLPAQLLPRLAQADDRYGEQLPMMIGVSRSLIQQRLAASTWLNAGQKHEAQAAVSALDPWARRTPWFDQARARQAIDVAVAAARALPAQRYAALSTLNFETSMKAAAGTFRGAARALDAYGLSIDAALASVQVTVLSRDGDHARMRVAYLLAGQPLAFDTRLVQLNGRWYSQSVLDAARRWHAQAAAP